MRVLYVSGADEKYFLTALAFIESLRGKIDLSCIRVCDFGLNSGQSAFLQNIGVLLERPAALPKGAHPYLCKGHLVEYLSQESWEAVLWLDSDMLIGALDHVAIQNLAKKLLLEGKALAASPDVAGRTIGELLADLVGQGRIVAPAVNLLKRWNVSTGLPYLTAGLMLFVDRKFMREWMVACRTTAPHVLWEQNVLNALVGRAPERVEALDVIPWQISDALLEDVALPDPANPHDLRFRGVPIATAHATSTCGQHLDADLNLAVGTLKAQGYMRLFAKPALNDLQLRNLTAFIKRHHDALSAFGALASHDVEQPTT